MKRKCPRTLDKPLLLFGLEVEDIGLLSLVGGLGSILFGPIIPGLCAIAGWIFLMQFKKGKPSGYLLHWLYSKGVGIPGLLPPIQKVNRYGVYARNNTLKKITFR